MILKWIFDRLVSLIGLISLCWLYLIVAILIRFMTDSGQVFFTQKRVGKDGKLFKIHKFCTMAPNHGGSSITVARESRITRLGSQLRHYKIDELPELWDVFVANMSFVGPRPDVPGYADKLEGDDREVLKLRPGITGPASLKYRIEEDILATVDDPQKYNDEVIYPDKVRINRYYLHHYSFIKDIQMIICTVFGINMEYGGEII